MNVEIFSLCDQATSPTDKLNLVGVFDHIAAGKAPLRYPGFTVAARVRFDAVEYGNRQYRIELIDEDGRAVLPPTVGVLHRNCWDQYRSDATNLVVSYQDVNFPRFGRYEVSLVIEGRLEATAPLTLTKVGSAVVS